MVSYCGAPLLISYHLKYIILYENTLGLDFVSFGFTRGPPIREKSGNLISDSLGQPCCSNDSQSDKTAVASIKPRCEPLTKDLGQLYMPHIVVVSKKIVYRVSNYSL